ncbi:MAG: hypothetical protein RL693_1317 [Verrucomicrobiota bacterium]|jgi:outer membrane protein TolC
MKICCITLLALLFVAASAAEESASLPTQLDIANTLRLAGARNTEIQIAEAHSAEAMAARDQVIQKFWPTLSTGFTYKSHDGRIQNVEGRMLDTNKQSYTAGAGIWLDWSPAQIYYESLAARQKAAAAAELIGKSRADVLLLSASRYYDLLEAEAALAVTQNDLQVNAEYARQLEGGVAAGTVFRGDLLKVKARINRNEISIRQGIEQCEVASARLAEVLRLDAAVKLRATKTDLVPLRLQNAKNVKELTEKALLMRPEVQVQTALSEAAAQEKKQATVAPWYPSLTANYGFGGLGGGQNSELGKFGDTEDSFIGLGWKIGPGGLFDGARKRTMEARVTASHLELNRSKEGIARQVAESTAKVRSLADQITISSEAVRNSEELVKLARDRQANQIGVVLEFLVASEELSHARMDQVNSITEHNKAQYALRHATGELDSGAASGK